MKKGFIYFMVGITLFFTIGCTQAGKSGKNENASIDMKADSILTTGFDNSLTMPSPDEVMSWFGDLGLNFKPGLVNKPENFDKYLTSKTLSLNLGVYVADAAYLNMFKQYEVLPNYLENIFNINDKLNLSGVYLEFDFKEVFKRMNNPDSLIVISEGMYRAISNYMIETGNEPMLCLISHGSLVELLYITLQSVEVFTPDNQILQAIADQYMQLDNLYNYALEYGNNEGVQEMLTQLSAIKSIYAELEQIESENSNEKSETGVLTVKGGVKHQFTAEQFLKLKETVGTIRSTIIL